MKLKLSLMAAALLLVAGSSQAQDDTNGKYFCNEFSFDAFGSYTKSFVHLDDMFDHTWRHGHFGGGVGLNYFMTRYLGIGADTFFFDGGEFFKNVTGNLILRIPIGNSGLAPYIFGGGGHRFAPVSEWTYGGGVGLEFRFTRHVGLFTDLRYTWADKTIDANLARVGMRFAF